MLVFSSLVLSFLSCMVAIQPWGRIGLAGLLLVACVVRDWRAFYITFTFFLMSLYWVIVPEFLFGWPALPMLIPGILSSLVIYFLEPNLLSWVKKGSLDRVTRSLILVTGIVSTAALILWAFWTDNLGFAAVAIQQFASTPLWIILLVGVPLFALLNALAEEIIFRGILQNTLYRVKISLVLVICVQSLLFAAFHFASGFPNGWMGFAMVFVYALALGYLRQRTSGLLAPFLAHVVADLTIGYFLVWKFL